MTYITRNANLILLFLIVISAAALVGATVYFQTNFDRINDAYKIKLDQLNKVSEELEQQQTLLAQVKGEFAIKAAREEEISEKFTTVRGEKETLEGEKTQLTKQKQSLESELKDTEQTLLKAQSELSQKKDYINQLEGEVITLENSVDKLKKDKDKLDSQINALQSDVSCLKSTADADEGSC